MQTLRTILDEKYFPLNLKIRSEFTRYQYRHVLDLFAQSLGHDPLPSDLDDDAVTFWCGQMLGSDKSISTVRETANRVLALWRWMAKRRMVERFPTVCLPDAPETSPLALTEQQLRNLFASASRERGHIAGIPASLFWSSYLAFVWTTSERKSAALAVQVDWIDFGSRVCKIPPAVRKGKKKWGVYTLWPETLELIADCIKCQPLRQLVWPWDRCRGSYYTSYDRILTDAGIPVSRKTKTHCLRVSHATWLKALGGDPTRALGHSDGATTSKHYLDYAIMPPQEKVLFAPWK